VYEVTHKEAVAPEREAAAAVASRGWVGDALSPDVDLVVGLYQPLQPAAGQEFVADLQEVIASVIRHGPLHEVARSGPKTGVEPIHNPIGFTITDFNSDALPGPKDTRRHEAPRWGHHTIWA
jgi:hypothetical protein